MAWFIGQSIVMIAAAFLLGILVGWLAWGRARRTGRPPRSLAEEHPPATPVPAEDTRPADEQQPEAPAEEPEPADRREVEPIAAEAVQPDAPEPADRREVEPVAAAGAAELESVAAVAVLEQATPDDLERIEGIGPKMAGALHDSGIRTYAELAGASETALRQAIESHGLRFAPSLVTWSRQARLLADGDEEGFADLTRRLVAGRDEGRE